MSPSTGVTQQARQPRPTAPPILLRLAAFIIEHLFRKTRLELITVRWLSKSSRTRVISVATTGSSDFFGEAICGESAPCRSRPDVTSKPSGTTKKLACYPSPIVHLEDTGFTRNSTERDCCLSAKDGSLDSLWMKSAN
ncbi:hypothetical protein D3C73_1338800 [compost metagenome]